jgi:hypothetical protein
MAVNTAKRKGMTLCCKLNGIRANKSHQLGIRFILGDRYFALNSPNGLIMGTKLKLLSMLEK